MKNKQDLIRFFKFLGFSCGAGIIQLGTFTLLNEVFHLNYWLCYLTGLVLSVLFNFTLNKAYTFKSADNIPKCMALVFLFYVFFTPLSTLAEHFFTKTVNEYIVTISIMVSNFILEFIYCRFVVYRKTINTKK
jgi:putative flippase GtrA